MFWTYKLSIDANARLSSATHVGCNGKIAFAIFGRRGTYSLELNKLLIGRQIILWPPRNVTAVWWGSGRNFKQIMSATTLVAGRDKRAIAAEDTDVRSVMHGTGSTSSGAATATLWLAKSVEGIESKRFASFGVLRLGMSRWRPTYCRSQGRLSSCVHGPSCD